MAVLGTVACTPRLRHAMCFVCMLAGALAGVTQAGQPPVPGRTPIDVSRLGPQVGERVPDFALEDQNGKRWTLPAILGAKGAMLVFFRSADW